MTSLCGFLPNFNIIFRENWNQIKLFHDFPIRICFLIIVCNFWRMYLSHCLFFVPLNISLKCEWTSSCDWLMWIRILIDIKEIPFVWTHWHLFIIFTKVIIIIWNLYINSPITISKKYFPTVFLYLLIWYNYSIININLQYQTSQKIKYDLIFKVLLKWYSVIQKLNRIRCFLFPWDQEGRLWTHFVSLTIAIRSSIMSKFCLMIVLK